MAFIYLLQNSPAFFISFCSIAGMMVGSFLNVVIYRLP
ncbi:MAG: prepilin peptidase, partial [Nitrosospira sp.]